MKTIVLTLPLAASLLFGSAAEAASPRAELLAGVDRGETVIEIRHDRGARHGNGRGYGHDFRRGHHDDHRGRGDGRDVRQARRYAAEAVDQAREARRLGRHPDHPRWSMNFERHFHWALGAPDRALQREHYRRAAQLREWRREAAYYRHGRRGHGHPY